MNITTKGNSIYVNNFIIYNFEYNIRDFKIVSSKILILLESPPNSFHNENIYCIDESGNVIWQVEKITHIYPDSPYDKIIVSKGDVLQGYNYDGCVYNILIDSGRIISRKFLK